MDKPKAKKYCFELTMMVRDYEVDSQGIVNNANYLHYMEHTRHEFCRHAGYTFRDMQHAGIDPVLRRVTVDYMSPLRLGDQMRSCLALRIEGARFIFVQDIYNAVTGQPVVKAEATIVCVENGRLTRGEQLAAAFKDYI